MFRKGNIDIDIDINIDIDIVGNILSKIETYLNKEYHI